MVSWSDFTRKAEKIGGYVAVGNRYVWLLTALVFLSTVPFLLSDTARWDLHGHIQEAELQADMLPSVSYWNGYHGTGYEPYSSYSVLPRLLPALLSFVVPIELAVKWLLVAAWTAVPYAVSKLFSRAVSGGRLALYTSLVVAALYALPLNLGYTFLAAFTVGNFASILAFPLLLIALSELVGGRYWRVAWLSALLTCTHALSAVFFFGVLLCFAVFDWEAVVGLAGYGVAGFWAVPFLVKSGHYEVFTFVEHAVVAGVFFTAVVAAYGTLSLLKNGREAWQDALFLAMNGVVAATFFRWVNPAAWASLPMHFHRLFVPAALIGVVAVVRFVDWEVSWYEAAGVLVVFSAFLAWGASGIASTWHEEAYNDVPSAEGRVLFSGTLGQSPHWHAAPYEYIRDGVAALPGLFVEASPVAEGVFVVQDALQGRRMPSWGVQRYDLSADAYRHVRSRLPRIVDLLGVRTVASLRCLGGASCVSTASVNGSVVSADFVREGSSDVSVAEWVLSSREKVVAPDVPNRSGDAELVSVRDAWNEVDVSVDSEKPVPVFVSVSYSDGWRASTESAAVPVRRAEPFGVVVIAQDDFTLSYDGWRSEHAAGLLISVLSVIVLVGIRSSAWSS